LRGRLVFLRPFRLKPVEVEPVMGFDPFHFFHLCDEERGDAGCQHGHTIQYADRRDAERVSHTGQQHGGQLHSQRSADDAKETRIRGQPAWLKYARFA
jgi:hypothetical protein